MASLQSSADRSDIMGTERIGKLLLQFAIPAILMTLVSALYNAVDKVFVGQFVGEIGITATTVAAPAMRIVTAFASLIGAGGNSLLALRLGEGRKEEAEGILSNSFTLIIIICLIVSIFGLIFNDQVLRLFGTSDEAMEYAKQYYNIIMAGAVFEAITSGFSMFIRTDGSPKRMMMCSIVGCLINLVLDPLLIHVFGLGIAGAAIATVFAQIIAAVITIHYFTLSKRSSIKLHLIKHKINLSLTKKTTQLGFSSFLQHFMGGMVQTLLLGSLAFYAARDVSGVSGDIAQASVGVTLSVGLICVMPVMGLQQAFQPIIGYNYGAGNYKRVLRTLKLGVSAAFVIAMIGWLVMMLFAEPICRLFGVTGDDLTHAAWTLRVYNVLMPLMVVSSLGSNFFQAIGQPTKAILVGMSRQILCLIPLILILPLIFGLNGVIYALPGSDLISCLIGGALLIREIRRIRQLPEKSLAVTI